MKTILIVLSLAATFLGLGYRASHHHQTRPSPAPTMVVDLSGLVR